MITYSINAHPVIALMFSQTGTDVLPRRDEGSDKPSATIEPHRIMVPTRTRTQAAGLKVRCRYHYTTAAHIALIVLIVLKTSVLYCTVLIVLTTYGTLVVNCICQDHEPDMVEILEIYHEPVW